MRDRVAAELAATADWESFARDLPPMISTGLLRIDVGQLRSGAELHVGVALARPQLNLEAQLTRLLHDARSRGAEILEQIDEMLRAASDYPENLDAFAEWRQVSIENSCRVTRLRVLDLRLEPHIGRRAQRVSVPAFERRVRISRFAPMLRRWRSVFCARARKGVRPRALSGASFSECIGLLRRVTCVRPCHVCVAPYHVCVAPYHVCVAPYHVCVVSGRLRERALAIALKRLPLPASLCSQGASLDFS
eukprot:2380848-Pleurochrysis_carterae.AAC.3